VTNEAEGDDFDAGAGQLQKKKKGTGGTGEVGEDQREKS